MRASYIHKQGNFKYDGITYVLENKHCVAQKLISWNKNYMHLSKTHSSAILLNKILTFSGKILTKSSFDKDILTSGQVVAHSRLSQVTQKSLLSRVFLTSRVTLLSLSLSLSRPHPP